MNRLAIPLCLAMLATACEEPERPQHPSPQAMPPRPRPVDAGRPAPDAAAQPDVAACVESEHQLFAVAGHPIVCGSAWSECTEHPLASDEPGVAATDAAACCMQLDVHTQQITHVAHPRATPDPTVEVRGDSICRGATCKPLGNKLAATIATLRANATADDVLQLSSTDSVEAVVARLSRTRGTLPELWSVAKDAPIKLVRPGPQHDNPPPDLTAVGEVVVVDWYACAGPCHEAELLDTNGHQVGDMIEGYTSVFRIDDQLFAIASDTAGVYKKSPPDAVQLFDLRTGKARGKIALSPEDLVATVQLDSDRIAALTGRDSIRVVEVQVAKPAHPKLVADIALPACSP